MCQHRVNNKQISRDKGQRLCCKFHWICLFSMGLWHNNIFCCPIQRPEQGGAPSVTTYPLVVCVQPLQFQLPTLCQTRDKQQCLTGGKLRKTNCCTPYSCPKPVSSIAASTIDCCIAATLAYRLHTWPSSLFCALVPADAGFVPNVFLMVAASTHGMDSCN